LLHPAGWFALVTGLFRWRLVRFFFREVRRATRRGNFLVACRMASTVGFYLRFRRDLEGSGARAVLVSSDSNPYAMGLAFAASSLGLRTIYITHGHLPEGPPRLLFDLSILDGPAVVEVYERSCGLEGQVVFKGAEGTYRALDLGGLSRANPTVGVFMSLITDWERFETLVQQLYTRLNPARIIVRLHPNKVVRDQAAVERLKLLKFIELSTADTVLTDDAERCDVVVAGNSSCHLTTLKFGVPTLFVPGLDAVPHDFYKFLERRIVPEFGAAEAVDLAAVSEFYKDPGWADRFASFDASYPDKTGLDADVAAAVKALL